MNLQLELSRAEAFLTAPFRAADPIPVLRTPRGRLVAIRDHDGKIGWNIDLYDVDGSIPTHPTLAALLLLMSDRQKAVSAYTRKQKPLQQRLETLQARVR